MNYTPVIGLEVHVELKTKSKMFCICSSDYFGKEPNTHCCPTCLGLPGALPVPNKKAIEWCIMVGLALNCDIPLFSKFDRKNYFYPDLPKGYQISQYDQPFCTNGSILVKSNSANPTADKKIRIRRVHMEEDTGKLLHARVLDKNATLIDFNRSGVPLVEIVTEPDFHTATDVKEYLQRLQQIVRYLDVATADMEKGQMRLEPNISLQKKGTTELAKYKVEVKNINSFRFVEKAIDYEIKRQEKILEEGKTPVQETRGWNEVKNQTVSQRVKEEANDYRYFPDPDIPPFTWSTGYIAQLKKNMPELPNVKQNRFIENYGLSTYDSEQLTREKTTAEYFEEAVVMGKTHKVTPKEIANTIINKKMDITTTLPAQLVKQITAKKLTVPIDKNKLDNIIAVVLSENQKAVNDFKKEKEPVIMFIIGQVMKKLGKKTDVSIVKDLIIKQIQQE